jgi:hypothetical protein
VDPTSAEGQGEQKSQVYTHQADWFIYALGFSNNPQSQFRIAISSFLEDISNKVGLSVHNL